MKQLKPNATITVEWKTNVYDYSESKVKDIIDKLSKKYGVDKHKIKVITNFTAVDNSDQVISIKDEVIGDIQNPAFQQGLFKEFLELNNIKDYDLKELYAIDNQVNSNIDFDAFERGRRYIVKWVKWDNFLSYGEDNQFDFSKYNGLVLLNGEPANQSGKTTFAMELIRFILFGKVTKCDKQEKIFNRYLPSATTVNAEMCISIDNEDYIIKRTLTRPALEKRTANSATKSSIEYYKVAGNSRIELSEYDKDETLNAESVGQTNKAIKEAIGNEDDFDLTLCASSKSLDDLIDKKTTERGRILSRWIGLGSLEKKDEIARDIFNKSVRPSMIIGQYNVESLNLDSVTKKENNERYQEEIDRQEKQIKEYQDKVDKENDTIKHLSTLKTAIDQNVIKLDITTINTAIDTITQNGVNKKYELDTIKKELEEIGDVEFSNDEYKSLFDKKSQEQAIISSKNAEIRLNFDTINKLQTSEYCPTCGRKYEGIDNSAKIKELNESIDAAQKEVELHTGNIKKLDDAIAKMSENATKYKRKSELTTKSASIEVSLANMRTELLENREKVKQYNANKEAISKNNELDIQINLSEANIRSYNQCINTSNAEIIRIRTAMATNDKDIENNNNLIARIQKEEVILRNWKMYLDIIGKNGIGKMVLRKALPIINANLDMLLSDVVDFTVEVVINDKNEVDFLLVHDGVKDSLHSGSGLEMTASALALRTVLANISSMGRPQFIVLDEILGRVAKENYENMHNLYNKILESYSLILQVSHLQEIQDWHDGGILTVIKDHNVSRIFENK